MVGQPWFISPVIWLTHSRAGESAPCLGSETLCCRSAVWELRSSVSCTPSPSGWSPLLHKSICNIAHSNNGFTRQQTFIFSFQNTFCTTCNNCTKNPTLPIQLQKHRIKKDKHFVSDGSRVFTQMTGVKSIGIYPCYMYTVGAIIIWSFADFVGLPTYKEWNYV